jgi:hypothetical protein
MNQGTQGYSLTKKPEGRKSRDTVPLSIRIYFLFLLQTTEWEFHGEKFQILPAGGSYQSCQQMVNDVITIKVVHMFNT